MRFFQHRYGRVFRRMVVRGVRIFHLVLTTAHEIYVLAPNDTIFEIPTFGGDVYLPGISRGSRASINTLYAAAFDVEDTHASVSSDPDYDSDNNLLLPLAQNSPPYQPTLGSNSNTEIDDEFAALVRPPAHAFRPIEPAPLSPTNARPSSPQPFAQHLFGTAETKEEGELQEGKEETSPPSSPDIYDPSP